MKKLFLLGALFAAGLSFTACSSGNDSVDEQPTSILDKFDAKGQAKVSFLISTAASATPGTRAAGENSENDNYVVGDADEYAIKDATLVLFQGTAESSATFLGAYTLTATNIGITDTDVSALYTATISNEGISSSNKIYALVMANAGSSTNSVLVQEGTTWKLNGTELSSSTTFSAFQTTQLAAEKLGNQTKGMLMSNAPLSTMKDTKTSEAPTYSAITTLVEVSGDNIATTESSASANPVRVYIERAAAKVQVIIKDGVNKIGTDGLSFTPADVKWITDNKEPNFYTVRVAEGSQGSNINSLASNYYAYTSEKLTSSWTYRFFSALAESTRNPNLYRTYWAIDPNYFYTSVATEGDAGLVGTTATAAQVTNAVGESTYEYITENTFNEFGMTKNSTTRVVIAIPFNSGKDFFTIDGADGVFTLGASSTDGTLAAKVLEYVLAKPDVVTWLSDGAHNEQSKITVTVAETGDAGAMSTGITVAYSGGSDEVNTSLNTACGDIYAGLHPIRYKDGLCYYQVRIKHFGDSQTPLGTPAGSTYTQLYGDPSTSAATVAKNFLGRYAVVRNNWYIVQVTAVKQLGLATIPTPDWTPDDDNNQYITTEIYVNKWAQRTQDAELY